MTKADKHDLLEACALIQRVLRTQEQVHGELVREQEIEKTKLVSNRIDREIDADIGDN